MFHVAVLHGDYFEFWFRLLDFFFLDALLPALGRVQRVVVRQLLFQPEAGRAAGMHAFVDVLSVHFREMLHEIASAGVGHVAFAAGVRFLKI